MNNSFTVSPGLGGSRIVRPSAEALDAAVIREMLTGEEHRRQLNERKREQAAYKQAVQYKGSQSKFAKVVATIPVLEFFAMSQKYGPECWGDKGFIRDYQRKFPHLSPSRA